MTDKQIAEQFPIEDEVALEEKCARWLYEQGLEQ